VTGNPKKRTASPKVRTPITGHRTPVTGHRKPVTAPPSPAQRRRAALVLVRLRKQHPDARCELDFTNPLELAVAAILAAQCTDKRVNMVTPALFRKYRTAAAYAKADPATLEEEIRTTGFFRNKARSIRALGAALVERHGGDVPADFGALVKLPGVGRKTAHLLMADAFGRPGMIVDTHQIRVNRRLEFTKHEDADRIEADLRALVPECDWTDWSHHITFHGRYCCVARTPKCGECSVNDVCPSAGRPERA
jgi:endonuclease-3